ncbi:hypothetical protein BD324DRAFT_625383 [Kockovaella imperatae]|uniref:Uncharacterized protein n=1 Tax=Kockovaella imperatae TaxID=4999 RepID=A0A1Y1UGY9_9TREE|nr:hypothetical protein BD324DRAFT_625383 [Kockovaella imperatae]ORX37239.1 hypothetical protein BD324DRAFT_625383 [Kockovaella imperatae]
MSCSGDPSNCSFCGDNSNCAKDEVTGCSTDTQHCTVCNGKGCVAKACTGDIKTCSVCMGNFSSCRKAEVSATEGVEKAGNNAQA